VRVALFIGFFAAPLYLALETIVPADNPSDARVWTDHTGQFQVQSRLLKVEDHSVHLQRDDGRVIQVPLARLSEADRAYVAQRLSHTAATVSKSERESTANASADSSSAPQTPHADGPEAPAVDFAQLLEGLNAFYSKRFANTVTHADFQHMEHALAALRAGRGVLSTGEVALDVYYEALAKPDESSDEGWREHFALHERWRQAFPQSVAPLVIQARGYIRWAWQARGGGYAHTVTEDRWRLFHERIATARELLEAADKLEHNDPDVYHQLIIVGRAEGAPRKEVDRWLSRAQQIDNRYYVLYEAMADYLMPRWCGEPGDVEQFAAAMAKKVGGEHGLDVYARVIGRVNVYEHDVVIRPAVSRETLLEAVKLQRSRYPHSERFLNFAALVAWVAEDRALAQELAAKIETKWDPQVWGGREPYEHFRRWCHPPKGPGEQALGDERETGDLAYSPDGRWLATTSSDPMSPLKLWDSKTRILAREYRAPVPRVRDLVFEPQGERIAAVCNEGLAFIWKIDQPEEPMSLIGHSQSIFELDWSADGQTVATGSLDRTARIWNAGNGEEKLCIELPVRGEKVRLSPDGKLLAIYGDQRFFVWDAITGRLIYESSRGPGDTLNDLMLADPIRFLEDGALLVIANGPRGGAGRKLLTLNPFTGERKVLLDEEVFTYPDMSQDGRYFASGKTLSSGVGHLGGRDATIIRVMDVPNGRLLGEVEIPIKSFYGLAFSPDGAALAVNVYSRIEFLDVASLPRVELTGDASPLGTSEAPSPQ
jgi:hypothetical protein